MGSYGVEWFENDSAADWIGEMEAGGNAEDVRRALERVARERDWVDASDAFEALAAAEVVAAVRGYPEDTCSLRKLVRRMPTLIDDAPLALAAISAVVDPERSELYRLRDGGPSLAEWLTVVEDLRHRLEA